MSRVPDVNVDAILREVEAELPPEQEPEVKPAAGEKPAKEPKNEPEGETEASPPRKLTASEAVEERRRRKEDKAHRDAARDRLKERESELSAREAQVQKDREELEKFRKAKATGDFGTLAQMLGFKDEAEMSRAQLEGHADPTAKAVKELQHTLEERDRKDRAREERAEQEAARQREQAERDTYEQTMATRIKQMTTLPAKLRIDPKFHAMVIQERDDQFDEDTGETISLKEAATICLDRLKEGRKALDDYLDEGSPDQTGKSEKPTGGQPETTEKKAPKKAPVVSQRDLSEISEEATVDDVGLEKILEIEGRRLQNSVRSR